MNKTCLLVGGFATILMVTVGCNGTDEVVEPVGTQVSLIVSTDDPAADETTAFKVTASNAHVHLTSIALDYTNDGNWDDTRSVDASTVTAAFTWIYHTAGTYTVRAEVRDADDQATTATVQVTVGVARSVPVSFLVIGRSAEGGACYAFGPPAACSGCSASLGDDFSTAVRHSLGLREHGSFVSVSQGFSQAPYASGQDVFYACSFSLRIVSGAQPYETTMGTGNCTTTSKVSPAQLNCTATVSGIVP